MYAISTVLLFLVAGKASRIHKVTYYFSSIVETFHDVQNANRLCTAHAAMSTESANDQLITVTVHAPFLAIAPNQNATLQFVLCTIDPQC